jgi:hypothetical protein
LAGATASIVPHVVEAVGELDQDHANVARHRQQHLAERLGLRFLAGREAELVELREAVDEVGGRGPEALDQLGLRNPAILHRIVHQRGHDRLRIELPFGAEAGDRDRVRDVGFAARAELPQVGLVGEPIGVANAPDVGGVEVVELRGQGRERGGGGIVRGWRLVRPSCAFPTRDAGREPHSENARAMPRI